MGTLGDTWGGFRGHLGTLGDTWGGLREPTPRDTALLVKTWGHLGTLGVGLRDTWGHLALGNTWGGFRGHLGTLAFTCMTGLGDTWGHLGKA